MFQALTRGWLLGSWRHGTPGWWFRTLIRMGAPTLSFPCLWRRGTEKLVFAVFCSQLGLVQSLTELCALSWRTDWGLTVASEFFAFLCKWKHIQTWFSCWFFRLQKAAVISSSKWPCVVIAWCPALSCGWRGCPPAEAFIEASWRSISCANPKGLVRSWVVTAPASPTPALQLQLIYLNPTWREGEKECLQLIKISGFSDQKPAVLPVPRGSGESKRLFHGNGRLGAEFALVSSLARSLPQLRKAGFSVLGTLVLMNTFSDPSWHVAVLLLRRQAGTC